MARPEKKTATPHLRAVKAEDAPPVGAPATMPAAASPAMAVTVPTTAKSMEVSPPRRRTFTAEFKRQVLAEADACTEPGAVGALLRRHHLYSSHLTEWRRTREESGLAGLAPRKRGRKATPANPLAAEVAKLQRALKKAEARAVRAEGLVAVQKKLAELFGEEMPPEEELLEAERLGLPIPQVRKKR